MATEPVQTQTTQTTVRRAWTLQRALFVAAAVMFVLASFAAGEHTIAGISALTWAFGSFAAWMLAFVV
jgi:hypothetical protein